MTQRIFLSGLISTFGLFCLPALTLAQAPSGKELAAELNAAHQDGTSYIRMRLEVNGGGAIQIQSKQRHVQGSSEAIYQILFPKERKGESVLLKKTSSGAPSGSVFIPPSEEKSLSAGDMKQRLFGSDLTYEDMIGNFFAWSNQSIQGQEDIGRHTCWILQSKPSGADHSSYASVKSWIDVERKVPLKVEKYDSKGALRVSIETTNVEKDDLGRYLPASLEAKRSGSGGSSVFEGSRIKHGVGLTDADFTPQALKDLTVPK